MKYYLLSGEVSGDIYGGELIKAIKTLDKDAEFVAFGGEKMRENAAKIRKDIKELSIMGFWEVLKKLKTVLGNIRFAKNDILKENPDKIILIDFPGFNMRIAKWAKTQGFQVYYYIAPQAWAWNKKRVFKIKKYIDKLFVILPFEKEFFSQYGIETYYFGHPLIKELQNETFRRGDMAHKVSATTIAILPGSRVQEIKKILPIMLSVVLYFADCQFIIAVKKENSELVREIIDGRNAMHRVQIITDKSREVLANADFALVKSGTVTLEAAILECPQIVCYKTSFLSYSIARMLALVKFISLPNLIMNKKIVQELIQNDLNTKNLVTELKSLMENKNTQLKEYQLFKQKITSEKDANLEIAHHIIGC
ncbi:MAG: lipid-A-disaccharide synthase [Bacteroidales bacterium]|jgi:lipid-A-disaccharide synthase|nr:lipid-A-disaccharide synthase [Bacteroidales bacterium]